MSRLSTSPSSARTRNMFASAPSVPIWSSSSAQTQRDVTRGLRCRPRPPQGQRRTDQDRRRQPEDGPTAGERPRSARSWRRWRRSRPTATQPRSRRRAASGRQAGGAQDDLGGPKGSEDVVAVVPTEAAHPQEVAVVAPIKPKKAATPAKSTAIETGSIAHKDEKAAAPGAKPQVALTARSAPSVDAAEAQLVDPQRPPRRRLAQPASAPRGTGQGRGAGRRPGRGSGWTCPSRPKTLCKPTLDRGSACEVSTVPRHCVRGLG